MIADNWEYDSEQKEYTCPCGNPVPYKMTRKRKKDSGYEQIVDVYQCENYEGCPFFEVYTTSWTAPFFMGSERVELPTFWV